MAISIQVNGTEVATATVTGGELISLSTGRGEAGITAVQDGDVIDVNLFTGNRVDLATVTIVEEEIED